MTRVLALCAALLVSPLSLAQAPPPPGQPAQQAAPAGLEDWTAGFEQYAAAYTAGDAAGADAAIAILRPLMQKEVAAAAPAPQPAEAETRDMIGRRDVRVDRRDDRRDDRSGGEDPPPAAADTPLVAEQKQILARFDGYRSDFTSDAGRSAAQARYADLQRFEALMREAHAQ